MSARAMSPAKKPKTIHPHRLNIAPSFSLMESKAPSVHEVRARASSIARLAERLALAVPLEHRLANAHQPRAQALPAHPPGGDPGALPQHGQLIRDQTSE